MPMFSKDGFRFYFSLLMHLVVTLGSFLSSVNLMFIINWFSFQKSVERFFNLKIPYVQSDWGGLFCSLHKFFINQNMTYRRSCPHAHQQNGTVELKHRHIVKSGLAVLAHATMPQSFWADAFWIAVYLINCLPNPVIQH